MRVISPSLQEHVVSFCVIDFRAYFFKAVWISKCSIFTKVTIATSVVLVTDASNL